MPSLQTKRGVVTIAMGDEHCFRMAFGLARSLRRFSPGMPIALISDRKIAHQKDKRLFDYIIEVDASLGDAFWQKLNLDKYTPFDETLFIDCDCLAMKDVSPIFGEFTHTQFLYSGKKVTSGEWYGNVEDHLASFKIPWIGKHNSGVFGLVRGEVSSRILSRSRELMEAYEDHFEVFRGDLKGDEPALAVSLAEAGIAPVDRRGTITMTTYQIRKVVRLDVFNGLAVIDRGDLRAEPAIVHFCNWKNNERYLCELRKLEAVDRLGAPEFLVSLLNVAYSLPKRMVNRLLGAIR